MILYKKDSNVQSYAELAMYCNANGLVIEDKGDYYESANPPEPSKEQKQVSVRLTRNQYLQETDKFMIMDYPISEEERLKYKEYRTYLRDYTKQNNWEETNPLTFDKYSL